MRLFVARLLQRKFTVPQPFRTGSLRPSCSTAGSCGHQVLLQEIDTTRADG